VIAAIQDRAVYWWTEQAQQVAELVAFLEEYADATGAPDWDKLSAAKMERKAEAKAEAKARAKVERLKRQEEDRKHRILEEEQRKREEREQRRSRMTAEKREQDERKEREREARKRWARSVEEARDRAPVVEPEPAITRITREILVSLMQAEAAHTQYRIAECSGDERLPHFDAVEWHLEHATRRARRELKPLGAAAFTEREIAAWAESTKALAKYNAVIEALIEFLHQRSPTPGASNWYDQAWEHLQRSKEPRHDK
jgi:hypothetical protein